MKCELGLVKSVLVTLLEIATLACRLLSLYLLIFLHLSALTNRERSREEKGARGGWVRRQSMRDPGKRRRHGVCE